MAIKDGCDDVKVLMINSTNGLGSTGRNCTDIVQSLIINGHHGFIAYSVGENSKNSYMIGTRFEKKFHALQSRCFGLQGYFSTRGTRKLISYIENLKPDIVHFNNVHSNYINVKLIMTYLANNNIPVVLTLHDCWFYTGKCCHYQEVNCNKWKSGCNQCPKLKVENTSWFFDRTKKMWLDKKNVYEQIKYLYVIGVSDWITKQAEESILITAKKIVRIYNWVDFNIFQNKDALSCKSELSLKHTFTILGVAAKWDNSKGIDRFLELSDRLDDNYQIILIGECDKNIEKSNLKCVGKIQSIQKLAKYYSAADAFVTMSYEESFGKVSAEALACGTPVVCFDSTANSEIVGEGCGYIIPKGNIDSMIDAVQTIKNNGKGSYSENCIAYAKTNFNKEKNINDYIMLYEGILGERINA